MIEKYSFGDETPPNASKNVIDEYKTWIDDEVRADLDNRRSEMINVCQNFTHDFNKSVVIRSNNAFLGKAVYIVGSKRYDRRGTVGTYHYEHVYHATDMIELIGKLHEDNYFVFGVDNVTQSGFNYNLQKVDLPERSAFVYGEEHLGLSDSTLEACDAFLFIPQYGSVRSLNVSCAATCCMYEYTRQWTSNTVPNKFVR